MDCHSLDEHLMDFLYEELAADEMVEMRSHLEGCPRCTAEIARFQVTRRALQGLDQVEPPAAVSAKILHQAAAVRQRPRWFRSRAGRWLTFGAAPALAAAAAVVILLQGQMKKTVFQPAAHTVVSDGEKLERDESAPAVAAPTPAPQPKAGAEEPLREDFSKVPLRTPAGHAKGGEKESPSIRFRPPSTAKPGALGRATHETSPGSGEAGGAAAGDDKRAQEQQGRRYADELAKSELAQKQAPSPSKAKKKASVPPATPPQAVTGGLTQAPADPALRPAERRRLAQQNAPPPAAPPSVANKDRASSGQSGNVMPPALDVGEALKESTTRAENDTGAQRGGSVSQQKARVVGPDETFRTLLAESKNCGRVIQLVTQLEGWSYGKRNPQNMKNAYELRANCQSAKSDADRDWANARNLQYEIERRSRKAADQPAQAAPPPAGAPAAEPTETKSKK